MGFFLSPIILTMVSFLHIQSVISPRFPPTTTSGFKVEENPSGGDVGYPSPPSSLPTNGGAPGPISALSNGFRKSGFASSLLNGSVPESTIVEEPGTPDSTANSTAVPTKA